MIENLKLPIPEYIDTKLLKEYMNYQCNPLDYFNRLYGVNYVNNPKQIRRALCNLEQLVGAYKQGKVKDISLNKQKIKVDDKYTYEQQEDYWVLIEQTTTLSKGMQKKYKDDGFIAFIKDTKQIEIL